jgi:hypothetical protein
MKNTDINKLLNCKIEVVEVKSNPERIQYA